MENIQTSDAPQARILVMDDEALIRRLVWNTLSRFGHAVTEAANAEEAAALYHEALQSGRPFDLVILDVHIPSGAGGVELLTRLRATTPDLKAILCSGSHAEPVPDAPAATFLAKPYPVHALRAAVDELLAAPAAD